MDALESGYAVEVDRISRTDWQRLLLEFDDANFYQTWSYGEGAWGAKSLSRLVVRRNGRPVAMAQLRILRLPLLRSGVAYLNWGPLWKNKVDQDHAAHLKRMARALRQEYAENRGLVLRILPKTVNADQNRVMQGLFLEEGFVQSPDPQRTFIVDLKPEIEAIRQNLHRSWKRSLKSAEKQGLTVKEADQQGQYEQILGVYSQMKTRKKFFGNTQMEVLRINEDLPDELKLKILLCFHHAEIIAVLGWSSIGRICIPLIGATGDQGLHFKASFLLWWEMIKRCKENSVEYCDTATVHEKRNPGGYFFKQGLAGKDAQETTYAGRFESYKSLPVFMLMKAAMAVREKSMNIARRMKVWR